MRQINATGARSGSVGSRIGSVRDPQRGFVASGSQASTADRTVRSIVTPEPASTTMILRILHNTPSWVFALLLALTVLGLLQTRPRSLSSLRLLILPLVLLVLSLAGVLATFGPQVPALAAWALGVVAASTLVRRGIDLSTVAFDPATRRLHVPGSVWPLVLMLGLFCVKYAVGVTLAMRPELRDSIGFAFAASAGYGCFSGAFLGRAWACWSVSRPARQHQQLA